MSFDYSREAKRLIDSIGEERLAPIWDWQYCEYDYSFVGFIDKYAGLNIPKDFTVIDIGCCQAVQADYFKNHKQYIGVEPDVPPEYCLQQDNAVYFHQTAQEFIKDTLPCLLADGLSLKKTFVICSAVPDKEAQRLVAETFPYHRVTYPNRGSDVVYDAPVPLRQRDMER